MHYSISRVALYFAVIVLVCMSLVSLTHAGPFGGGSGGGFSSGGRVGPAGGSGRVGAGGMSSPSTPGGRFGQGASVIGDGMGGFKTYSQSGTGRYIGDNPTPGKVYNSDGSTSAVIPDGQGNLNIYGPQGTHKAYGGSQPKVDSK